MCGCWLLLKGDGLGTRLCGCYRGHQPPVLELLPSVGMVAAKVVLDDAAAWVTDSWCKVELLGAGGRHASAVSGARARQRPPKVARPSRSAAPPGASFGLR